MKKNYSEMTYEEACENHCVYEWLTAPSDPEVWAKIKQVCEWLFDEDDGRTL